MNIITLKNRKYRYEYFSGLLSGDFKRLYKEKCNQVFKKKGIELGLWGYWNKNGLYGILQYYGEVATMWCWRNTVNTHPYCFHDLYYLFYDTTGIELNFDEKNDWKKNLDILFSFVEDKFELYFTTNIETKYFYSFWFRCNKSWTLGQISIIAVMYKIRDIFSDYIIKNMEFALERGDPNDFNGIDITLTVQTKDKYKNTEKIKIQVKTGKIIEENNEGYIVKGAVNDLRPEPGYWCYVDIKNNETEIVLFQNIGRYIKRVGYNILFKKEIIHKVRIKESIMVAELLFKLQNYCIEKVILVEIEYLPGYKNEVIIQEKPEKMINIKIGDFKDEKSLHKLIENKFIELQKLFD